MSVSLLSRLFRAALWIGASTVTAAVLLDLNAVSVSVRVEHGHAVIIGLEQEFNGPVPGNNAPLAISYRPQERYSTGQCLYPEKGPLQNGMSALHCLLYSRLERNVYPIESHGTVQHFRIFNPFRGALLIGDGREELRLEINIPDLSVEVWKGPEKLKAVSLAAPSLLRTLTPLAAPCFVAMLVALVVGRSRRSDEPLSSNSFLDRYFDRAAASTIFVLGALIVYRLHESIFNRMPGFGDEMNYLIQARIFANGRLWVPEPALAEFFRVGWMDMFGSDGKIWGFHPPGVSVLFAVGWLAGLYWLPVPLIAGALFAVQYLLGLRIFKSRFAAAVYLMFFGSSHYILSLCSSFMSHPASLLFLSLFTLDLLKFYQERREWSVVRAALWLGCAFVTRPLSAVLFGIIPLLCIVPRLRFVRPGILLVSMITATVIASGLGFYTYRITGTFTVPYDVKGPEAGNGLIKRLEAPLQQKMKNLYRNVNEYQNRVHSFGIFGNVLLFFVPLFIRQKKYGALPYVGYATFLVFVFLHSILHWYGWKWEPRMLFDVSFIFFLISTLGLVQFISALKTRLVRFAAGGAFVILPFYWTISSDLPWRFSTEYKNYLSAPAGVRRYVENKKVENSLILFGSQLKYASYTPFNSLDFAGPVVYAQSLGPDYDYKLISSMPGRTLYYSPDGDQVEKRRNFYEADLQILSRYLAQHDDARQIVVIPWLRYANAAAHDALSAEKLDESELLALLRGSPGTPQPEEPIRIVLLGRAAALTSVLDSMMPSKEVTPPALRESVAVRLLPQGLRVTSDMVLRGLELTCYKGTTWEAEPEHTALVSSVSADQCEGENRSAIWETQVSLAADTSMEFFLDSDDGSALFIDGRLILDNNLFSQHGRERRRGRVELSAGPHHMMIKYFNGPGQAFIEAGIRDEAGRDLAFSVDPSFPLVLSIDSSDT